MITTVTEQVVRCTMIVTADIVPDTADVVASAIVEAQAKPWLSRLVQDDFVVVRRLEHAPAHGKASTHYVLEKVQHVQFVRLE